MRWTFVTATATGAVIGYVCRRKLCKLAIQLQNVKPPQKQDFSDSKSSQLIDVQPSEQDHPTARKKPTQFSDLPADLRLLIYDFIVEDDEPRRAPRYQDLVLNGPRHNVWRASKVGREMRCALLTSFWRSKMFSAINVQHSWEEDDWLDLYEGQIPFARRFCINPPSTLYWKGIRMPSIMIELGKDENPDPFSIYRSDVLQAVDGKIVVKLMVPVGRDEDDVRGMQRILDLTLRRLKKLLKKDEGGNKWYIEGRDFFRLASRVRVLYELESQKILYRD